VPRLFCFHSSFNVALCALLHGLLLHAPLLMHPP
jgi:hypothetical protein